MSAAGLVMSVVVSIAIWWLGYREGRLTERRERHTKEMAND